MRNLLAALLVALPGVAAAATVTPTFDTYEIVATPTPAGARYMSGFSLTFEDRDDDGLFSLNELLTYSGVTSTRRTYTTLILVPAIPGIADGTDTRWGVRHPPSSTGRPDPVGYWTYSKTLLTPPPAAVVPLPASVLLLGGVLAALGLARRRRAA